MAQSEPGKLMREDEYKTRRQLAIDHWPVCKHQCPNIPYACCGPGVCGVGQIFEDGEIDMLTNGHPEEVEKYRDRRNGFYAKSGCVLPLTLRPLVCLEENCLVEQE